MRAQGIPDQTVAKWHGHEHEEVVKRQTYTHPSMDEVRAAASDQNVTRQSVK